MTIRYVLYRIGADPGETEIDEACALAEIYRMEQARAICPMASLEQ